LVQTLVQAVRNTPADLERVLQLFERVMLPIEEQRHRIAGLAG
jgi:hypothetical protein